MHLRSLCSMSIKNYSRVFGPADIAFLGGRRVVSASASKCTWAYSVPKAWDALDERDHSARVDDQIIGGQIYIASCLASAVG